MCNEKLVIRVLLDLVEDFDVDKNELIDQLVLAWLTAFDYGNENKERNDVLS